MNSLIDYPRLSFLEEHSGKSYKSFNFDEAYFTELLSHMGVERHNIDWPAFELEHFEMLSDYLHTVAGVKYVKSIKSENAQLQKIQKKVKDLAEELSGLENSSALTGRLHDEILANVDPSFKAIKLSDFLGQKGVHSFEGFYRLFYDLQVVLERTKIQKPQTLKNLNRKPDDSISTVIKKNNFRKTVMEGLEGDLEERYQALVQEHALPTNYPLTVFVMQFEEMWHKFSQRQFTESRYEPDARQNISATIDAADLCLRKFGTDYPRSLVATKIREVREQMYRDMS